MLLKGMNVRLVITLALSYVAVTFFLHTIIISIYPFNLQESVFFFAECSTVVLWAYLSDRFGRRPVLLLGPLGLTFAMFFFGASTTFVPLVITRFFQGMFNGSIGACLYLGGPDSYSFVPRSVTKYDSRGMFKLL